MFLNVSGELNSLSRKIGSGIHVQIHVFRKQQETLSDVLLSGNICTVCRGDKGS